MSTIMEKKQLIALFFCSLAPPIIGYGFVPLIPVLLSRNLDASPSITGYLLAFAFFAQTLGFATGGYLSDRLNRRKSIIIIAGVINIPIIWLIGQASTIWQIALFAGCTWFLTGLEVVLISILTGLFANPATRGKVFGILTISEGIIAILTGLTFGRVVDLYGFSTLFAIIAVFELLLPIFALFLKDKPTREIKPQKLLKKPSRQSHLNLDKAFVLLLGSQLIAGMAIHVGSLGRSLTMTELGFSAAAISSTVAIGGIVSLPLRPILGEISDRINREFIMALLHGFTAIALIILIMAESLVQFWIGFAFLYISFIRGSVGAAMVTDFMNRDSLGRGMALYNVANRIGGILGFLITGYAIQNFGKTSTLVGATVLPVIGIFLMISIKLTKTSPS